MSQPTARPGLGHPPRYLLTVGDRVRATCKCHYWQVVGVAEKPGRKRAA